FIFYNGAAGGLIWAGLIFTATFVATWGVFDLFQAKWRASGSVEEEHWFGITTAYVFCYALTGLLIQRKFFPRRPPNFAGLIATMLVGAWALVPSAFLFFLNRLSWTSLEHVQPGNIFNVFVLHDDLQLLYHRVFAFGWLLLMLILSAKWFWRQMKNFRP